LPSTSISQTARIAYEGDVIRNWFHHYKCNLKRHSNLFSLYFSLVPCDVTVYPDIGQIQIQQHLFTLLHTSHEWLRIKSPLRCFCSAYDRTLPTGKNIPQISRIFSLFFNAVNFKK
jgi:hypothetical protein